MEQLKLAVNYKDDEVLRKSFNALAIETFGKGLDFEPWYQDGYWNDRYICYSFVDGNRVVSNVSVNKMVICKDGDLIEAIQIGTVMTHPDYRRRGLASKLIHKVFDDFQGQVDYIYLFGNDEGMSVYRACGFEPMTETKFSMKRDFLSPKETAIRPIDLSKDEDLELLKRISKARTPISQTLGVTNDEHLIMFYCTKFMGETLYYIEEFDTVVSYEIEDGVLKLYDIITQNAVDVMKILNGIAVEEVSEVLFHFTPDVDRGSLVTDILVNDDCTLLVKPKDETGRAIQYPMFSHA